VGQHFLDQLIDDTKGLMQMPHIEYVREVGSEGIELAMWLIARRAMADAVGGPKPRSRTGSTMCPRRTPRSATSFWKTRYKAGITGDH
jgi:hypothetical protein